MAARRAIASGGGAGGRGPCRGQQPPPRAPPHCRSPSHAPVPPVPARTGWRRGTPGRGQAGTLPAPRGLQRTAAAPWLRDGPLGGWGGEWRGRGAGARLRGADAEIGQRFLTPSPCCSCKGGSRPPNSPRASAPRPGKRACATTRARWRRGRALGAPSRPPSPLHHLPPAGWKGRISPLCTGLQQTLAQRAATNPDLGRAPGWGRWTGSGHVQGGAGAAAGAANRRRGLGAAARRPPPPLPAAPPTLSLPLHAARRGCCEAGGVPPLLPPLVAAAELPALGCCSSGGCGGMPPLPPLGSGRR